MEKYYLAVDIGASSGRHILGYMQDGKLRLEEIYRFKNGAEKKNGHLCWDIKRLFDEIVNGIAKCREIGKIPVSMGVDTWAVDFVLLDAEGSMLGDAVSYRDSRTKGADKSVYENISEKALYEKTGIQKQIFNSVYQLRAIAQTNPEYLEKAETFMMIPDYFHYLLTGVKKCEYTNATTTQLVNARTKTWDEDIISALKLPRKIFGEISMPGADVGSLSPGIQERTGFNCKVVLPATHDTGSAVMAVPSNKPCIYLSSGTWSLMGTERADADCGEKSRAHNFTNEGGYDYRFRCLKNIMGLWMMQSVKREYPGEISFGELSEAARASGCRSVVDCNDNVFLAPESMTGAIASYCRETGQSVPENIGDTARVIYHSLAKCYAQTVSELEEITGKEYSAIHIVGGGSADDYLNELTAEYTGKDVFAGPAESTATGNILAQMIRSGEFKSLAEARECAAQSFEIKKYTK